MSVYTVLSESDIQELLTHYELGQLVNFEGVSDGIENTNYRLWVKKGKVETPYFLTLFESLNQHELDFFFPLLTHLKHKGCSIASPLQRTNGELLIHVKGKCGGLFNCLSGYHPSLTSLHCSLIGQALGQLHLAGKDFPLKRSNNRGLPWVIEQVASSELSLREPELTIIEATLEDLQVGCKHWGDLPNGIIHGDLFPDNALFDAENLSGIIDFYNACQDYFIYDLSITLLAWSIKKDGTLNEGHYDALLSGYEAARPLTSAEHKAIPSALQLSALRFWISRLIAQKKQHGVSLTTEKSPQQMRDALVLLRNQ